jgi:hypothetical protein
MHPFRITMKGFDRSAEARIVIYGGLKIRDGEYILDTKESRDSIETDLRQTAETVEITDLTPAEFESISREYRGFYAPNTD